MQDGRRMAKASERIGIQSAQICGLRSEKKVGSILDQFVEEKADFVEALKKRGYEIVDEHGCVMVVASKDVYCQTTEDVLALAKELKYDMSFGVKVNNPRLKL